MKRTPLRRKTPIRKRRPGTRRGQPTAHEKSAIRLKVYERANGECELRLSDECIRGRLPWDGPDPWSHGHLVHLRVRSLGGWTEDNLRWGCWHCHLVSMHAHGMKVTNQTENEKGQYLSECDCSNERAAN